mmetsp:Transcript_3535/g.6699  ORF Transcript_3535/g.6699 Transcript_3535/m.6699 type:complete len:391 (+) Transcript_3535:42-1214(+)
MGCRNSKSATQEKPIQSGGIVEYPNSGGIVEAPKSGGIVEAPKSGGIVEAPKSGGIVEAPSSGGIVEASKPSKPDPSTYEFDGKKDEVLVKLPQSINGGPFNINNCVGCDIFILDMTAQVTIDECKDCRIFIGPCEGAVFFRDCKNCKFAFICKQLRTRDSSNIDLLLFCGTRPTIETTNKLRLGCLQFSYFMLPTQLAAAGLCEFNNPWSDVYDFNKDGSVHFTYLPENTAVSDLLPLQKLYENSDITAAECEGSALLYTAGLSRPRSQAPSVFFGGFGAKNARTLLEKARQNVENQSEFDRAVQRASMVKLTKEQTKGLLKKNSAAVKQLAANENVFVGIEFCSGDLAVQGALEKALADDGQALGWLSPTPAKDLEFYFGTCQPNTQI